MKVLAIIPAYNEADFLPWTLKHLRAQGVEPYVIDNWSTDGTPWLVARQCTSDCSWERFPDSPSATYDWTTILRRIEDKAESSDADWCIMNDADELNHAPVGMGTLAEALAYIDAQGYNAAQFRRYNFVPTRDAWDGSQDPETFFTHYEPLNHLYQQHNIKTWKNIGRVNLVASGGHQAMFAGRKTYPYQFTMKHYPHRSQAHGERKNFVERLGRQNQQERAMGMNVHYETFRLGHCFIRPESELIAWNAD